MTSTPITPEYLDHLLALDVAATPGPWDWIDNRVFVAGPTPGAPIADLRVYDDGAEYANAALIAEYRTAGPALVAEVERLTRERDEARRDAEADNTEAIRARAERDAARAEVERWYAAALRLGALLREERRRTRDVLATANRTATQLTEARLEVERLREIIAAVDAVGERLCRCAGLPPRTDPALVLEVVDDLRKESTRSASLLKQRDAARAEVASLRSARATVERLAPSLDEAVARARAEERERCAREVEAAASEDWDGDAERALVTVADRIRAHDEAPAKRGTEPSCACRACRARRGESHG